jgi:glycosyltransferase involved in cell wall biosynthesis
VLLRRVGVCLSLVMMCYTLLLWSPDVQTVAASAHGQVVTQSPLMFDPNAPQLVWYAGIGCDSSGFFNEIAAIMAGLHDILPDGQLRLRMGECSANYLASLIPDEAAALRELQSGSRAQADISWQKSIVVQHKLPGRPFAPQFDRGTVTRPLYLIGRVMTESVLVDRNELSLLETVDEVWVPTSFHVEVYRRHGVPANKLVAIPPAVHTEYYARRPPVADPAGEIVVSPTEAATAAASTEPSETFRFVSVFKWEQRKGFDILLSAFWTAFPSSGTPVELVLRSYKPHWEPGPTDIDTLVDQLALRLTGSPRSSLGRVVCIQRDLTKPELRDLYHSSHVFVLPSRGEGFCMPCVEAMAAGLPAIVTNFSGPSEYMLEAHSYPLKYKPQLNRDGSAEPDSRHLVKLMLGAYADPGSVKKKGRAASAYVAAHYSGAIVANKIGRRLLAIQDMLLSDSTTG